MPTPTVIPAKAGIQEGGGAAVKGRQVLPNGTLGCHPMIVIPAKREWMV